MIVLLIIHLLSFKLKPAWSLCLTNSSFSQSRSSTLSNHRFIHRKRIQVYNKDDALHVSSTLAELKMKRMLLLKEMLGAVYKTCSIEPPFFCSMGCNIFLGEGVYINREYKTLQYLSLFTVSPCTPKLQLTAIQHLAFRRRTNHNWLTYSSWARRYHLHRYT